MFVAPQPSPKFLDPLLNAKSAIHENNELTIGKQKNPIQNSYNSLLNEFRHILLPHRQTEGIQSIFKLHSCSYCLFSSILYVVLWELDSPLALRYSPTVLLDNSTVFSRCQQLCLAQHSNSVFSFYYHVLTLRIFTNIFKPLSKHEKQLS